MTRGEIMGRVRAQVLLVRRLNEQLREMAPDGVRSVRIGGAPGGKGGSGIVILRSDQDDQLPVKFGATTLTKMVFDGSEVKHLVYNGTRLFMERVRRCVDWSRPKMRFVLQEA